MTLSYELSAPGIATTTNKALPVTTSRVAPGMSGQPLYVNGAGVASPSISAPGMEAQAQRWMSGTSRPSIEQLMREGQAASPKASIRPPATAPGLLTRAGTLFSPRPALQSISEMLKPSGWEGMAKQGLKANAGQLLSAPGYLASSGIQAALDGLNTSTEDYAARLKTEPGLYSGASAMENVRDVLARKPGTVSRIIDDNLAMAKDLGVRSAGVLADLGNNVTLGQADRVGAGLAALQNGDLKAASRGLLLAPGADMALSWLEGKPSPVDQYRVNQEDVAPAPGMKPAEKPAPDPRSITMPPTQLDKSDPNNPINQARARQTSAPGVVKGPGLGMKNPLFSNNAENPTAGMNTVPGLSGQAGNLSTLGIDRAAIERGTQAEKELYQAKVEALDGQGKLVSGGGAATVGKGMGVDVLGERGGSKDTMAKLLDMVQNGKSKSQRLAAAQTLAQLHGDVAGQQNAGLAATSQQTIAQGNNQAALQREQLEQAGRAPGMQLDNAGKALDMKGRERIEKLMAHYESLNDQNDPQGTGRQALAAQLYVLQGKAQQPVNPKDYMMTVGGGQEWDEKAGSMRNVPQRVLDTRSGKFVDGGGQAQASAAPYPDGTELTGKDGQRYIVQNGQPVLKTPAKG